MKDKATLSRLHNLLLQASILNQPVSEETKNAVVTIVGFLEWLLEIPDFDKNKPNPIGVWVEKVLNENHPERN